VELSKSATMLEDTCHIIKAPLPIQPMSTTTSDSPHHINYAHVGAHYINNPFDEFLHQQIGEKQPPFS